MAELPIPPLPTLSAYQQDALHDLQILASAVVAGKLEAFAFCGYGNGGVLIAHNLSPAGNPHTLRGVIEELADRVRDEYVKRHVDTPEAGLVDAAGAKIQ